MSNPEELNLTGWQAALQRRQAQRLAVLSSVCPTCDDPRGPTARDCMPAMRYGDDCRHLEWKRNLEAVQERVARFRRYRLGKAEWEQLVTESSRPPRPPLEQLTEPADVAAHEKARVALERFTAGRSSRVLVLMGRTGTGKSLLAAWAACRFESALLAAASRANAFVSWDPILEAVDDATCLVLDDLGQERPSENGFASRNVATLLCDRINSGRRMIVTTNLELGELVERYDPVTDGRLKGRLLESAEFVSLGNTDLRVAAKRGQQ